MSDSETASEIDDITHIDNVNTRLNTLTEDRFSRIVDAATYIGTQGGGRLKGNAASIISRSLFEVGPDGSFGLYTAKGSVPQCFTIHSRTKYQAVMKIALNLLL